MLRTLLESARPHSLPIGSLVASVAVHVTLSIPAWTAAPEAAIDTTPESFITRALFLPPPDRVPSRATGAERLQWVEMGVPGPHAFIPDAPRPSPLGGGMTVRLAAAPPSPRDDSPGQDPAAGTDSAYSILQVDESVVRYAESGAPVYPTALLQQALEGLVRVRYVVGADGRVDTTTVHVLRSTHPGFTAAVVDALARMRFQPATIASKAVSQVVEQDFGFHIEPKPPVPRPGQQRDTTRLPRSGM